MDTNHYIEDIKIWIIVEITYLEFYSVAPWNVTIPYDCKYDCQTYTGEWCLMKYVVAMTSKVL